METSQNPADMFTKSLPRLKFDFCKEKVGVHSITPLKHELVENYSFYTNRSYKLEARN
jgi:hypothetical protein